MVRLRNISIITLLILIGIVVMSGCEINRAGTGSWQKLPELNKPIMQPNVDKGGEFRTALADLEKIKLPEGQKLNVVVTFWDLAYFGSGLTAGLVDMGVICQQPVDLYTYQPDKETALPLLKKANALFKVGRGLDDWVDPLVDEAKKENPNLVVIDVTRNIDLIGNLWDPKNPPQIQDYNPWFWLNPDNILSLADTYYQVYYTFYYDKSEQMLKGSETLKHNIGIFPSSQEQLGMLDGKIVIQDVPVWPYFAKYFDLTIVATLLPDGKTEPPEKRLKELAQSAKDQKVVAIIKTKGYGGDIADRFAKLSGLPVIELDPHPRMGTGMDDYFQQMLGNVNRLLMKFRELKLPEIQFEQPPAQQPQNQVQVTPEMRKQLEEAAKAKQKEEAGKTKSGESGKGEKKGGK